MYFTRLLLIPLRILTGTGNLAPAAAAANAAVNAIRSALGIRPANTLTNTLANTLRNAAANIPGLGAVPSRWTAAAVIVAILIAVGRYSYYDPSRIYRRRGCCC